MNPNTSNNWPDDETLVAFVDGRLEDAEAEKVRRFLAGNDEARLFVERLATSGELAKTVFDAALAAPASDMLADMIMGTGRPEPQATPTNVVSLPRTRAASASRYALPLAAAIALLIGAVGGYEWGRRGAVNEGKGAFGVAVGPIGGDSPVKGLLETRGSGELVPVAAGATGDTRHLMVIASFRDRAGRICREFEVLTTRDDVAPVTTAIACRHRDGTWHVEGAAQVTAAAPVPDKDFSSASGNDASAIEGLLEALGAKPALSKADEDTLLRRGWK